MKDKLLHQKAKKKWNPDFAKIKLFENLNQMFTLMETKFNIKKAIALPEKQQLVSL
jgi:hypothetical protein